MCVDSAVALFVLYFGLTFLKIQSKFNNYILLRTRSKFSAIHPWALLLTRKVRFWILSSQSLNALLKHLLKVYQEPLHIHAYDLINTTSIHSRIVWKHLKWFIFIYYYMPLLPFWIYHSERCVKLIFIMLHAETSIVFLLWRPI